MKSKNLRYDILNNLFNISVKKASIVLSEIINKNIMLNVPDVKIIDINNQPLNMSQNILNDTEGNLMVSSISFERKMAGKANLIFPEEKMRTFINLCLEDSELDLVSEPNFTDVDFDVIKEIGSIVLNSIMSGLGKYMNINFDYTLPEVKIFDKDDFSRDSELSGFMQALLLYITFEIENTEIEGAILVDLTLNSLNELIKNIDNIGDELNE